MYKTILVTLDASDVDKAILEHVMKLAKICGSRMVLVHVADGWAARTFGKEAVCDEVTEDRAYLEKMKAMVAAEGISVETHLLFGDPRKEIVTWVEKGDCDLIAMSTHGHRFLGDLFLGATASHVQHRVSVPVLLLRAK